MLSAALETLRRPGEVRRRAQEVLAWVAAGESPHFLLVEDRMSALAETVATVVRARFPTLEVPLHSRWRHFVIEGRDRAASVLSDLQGAPRARAAIDLCVVSVLLDAGAGPRWRYRDPVGGTTLARSEGLAAASLEAFRSGLFSADPADPRRCDARRLAGLDPRALAECFQVAPANPLAGFDGRVALLRRLGEALGGTGWSGADGRIGGLFDLLEGEARGGELAAETLLHRLLVALAPIWPRREGIAGPLAGAPLGDVWSHPAVRRGDATDRLVPLHKLSQWLAYSLVEPLAAGGIEVVDLGALTGLAEYRNGGLFVDGGALALREPAAVARPHRPGDELVVEWRALTVALLDRLAPAVRRQLGCSEEALPLARLLEGGTWYAGRRLAERARPGGGPPLVVESDGTVF